MSRGPVTRGDLLSGERCESYMAYRYRVLVSGSLAIILYMYICLC